MIPKGKWGSMCEVFHPCIDKPFASRYISDMLAWVHQALAGEREFVFSLFGDDKAATVEDAKHSSSGRGRWQCSDDDDDDDDDDDVPHVSYTDVMF